MLDDIKSIGMFVAGGVAAKESLGKLLGPTAEYFGEIFKNNAQWATENVHRMLSATLRKIGDRADSGKTVNIRTLHHVVNESRFVEHPVASEYFAGILASSCNDDGADDSAVPYVELLKELSSDEIRLHFVLYTSLSRRFLSWPPPSDLHEWNTCAIFVPKQDLIAAIQFSLDDAVDRLEIALCGLQDRGLVAPFSRVIRDDCRSDFAGNRYGSEGLEFAATDRGARLLLRAFGNRGLSPSVITVLNVEKSLPKEFMPFLIDPTAVVVSDLIVVESENSELVDAIEDLESKIEDVEARMLTIEFDADDD